MNESEPEGCEERVLILAPSSKDGEVCRQILEGAGISSLVCPSLDAVCDEMGRGAAAALITREAILADSAGRLPRVLDAQPPWSDFPLVVLTPAGSTPSLGDPALRAVGHMTLMKRPVPVAELISTIEAAIRDRRRQYKARDYLVERERQGQALREGEERFRQLADNIPRGFIYQVVCDAAGTARFSYLSGGVERICGVLPSEVLADPAKLYGRVVGDDLPRLRREEAAAVRQWGAFDCQFRIRGREGEVRWLHCRSAPRPTPEGGSVWDGIALDITAGKKVEGHQWLLAEAGRILGSSLDYEATLSSICRLVVPTLADWSALDLKGDDGQLRRLNVVLDDPEKLATAHELWRRFPAIPDDPRGVMNVVRTGSPELHDISDEILSAHARDPEHLALLRNLALRSVLIVPLVARGRTLGAMSLVTSESARRFDEADVQVATELAARAALAVDNARLFTEGQEAARKREEVLARHRELEEQLTLLVQASGSLSESLDLSSVLTAILDLSRRLVAADAYAVWRYVPGTGHWGIALASGLSDDYRRSTIDVVAETPNMPAAPVVAEEVEALPLLEDRKEAYRREGIRSLLAVPLSVHGITSGTLVFYYRERHAFQEVEIRIATALSNLAASAIGTAELYEELKDKDRRKDEFLAMLAHELRNPLSAISNAVRLARRSPVQEELDWAKEVIDRQAEKLARLIEDLLDVSRITRGKIRLQKEYLDARRVLQSAIESVRPLIEEKKHTLSVSSSPGGLPLEADPMRLEQILVNLLTNAAKYTEPGGRISVKAERRGAQIVVSVRDNGVGIPPEALPTMFELFAQGERSIARSEGGLGIGLTLVRKLAEMHDGSVSAQSSGPGTGSEFTLRLPAAEARPVPVREGSPPGSRRKAPAKASRVLVIDDNVDTARTMMKLLRLMGHDVRAAHDGPAGIDAARAHSPEIILLDIGLPGMDGYQVAERLRTEDFGRDATIIAVSGYGQDEDRRRSARAGFDHHLVKPVDHDALLALLGEASDR